MKLKVIAIVIIIQIGIISFLGYQIYQKKQSPVLDQKSYATIDKEKLIFNPESNLKYFYEPKANLKEKVDELPENLSESWPPYALEAIYLTNSDTLYERFEYETIKKDGVYRIITLGDSFTQGVFVDTKDNYPELLEEKLNNEPRCKEKFEVINLGVGGYDIQYAIERFIIRGKKYNPDLILWLLKGDDFPQVSEIIRGKEMKYYQIFGEEEIQKQAALGIYPHVDAAMEYLWNNFTKEEIYDYQKRQVERIFELTDSPVLVLIVGPMSQEEIDIFLQVKAKYPDSFYFTDVLDIYDDNKLFFPDRHPSREGYDLISSFALTNLRDTNLIPCSSE